MKKLLLRFVLFVLVNVVASNIFAHDISADSGGKQIYYVWTNNNTELAVSFRGDNYSSYDNEYSGSVVIPQTVTYNGNTYNVTSIGERAFYNCSGLTSISIPSSITTIGNYAFYGCSGLTSVSIPNSVSTIGGLSFGVCTGLESLSISEDGPELEIGESAFNYCTKLQITPSEIPNRVTSIGYCAFESIGGFNGVSYDELIYLGRVAYYYKGKMSGPSSWNSYPDIVIRDGTTCIAGACFGDCHLMSISIPNTVRKIGEYAFTNSQLSTITIPSSVTSVGHSLFNNGNSPETIIVDAGNPIYDSRNNCNAIIESQTNTLVTGCKNTIIPDDVTSIGRGAFYGNKGLTSIIIPNNVASIGSGAFYGCVNLTSVISKRIDPISLGTTEFSNISNSCCLYVPEGTSSTYINNGWTTSKFKGGVYELFSVIADDKTITYGSNIPDLTYTVSPGHTISGTPSLSCSATSTSPVGTYPIEISQGSVVTQGLVYINGTLTITKKELSNLDISIDPITDVTYNGSAHTPVVTVQYGSTTLTSGTDFTVSYSNNTNAGTATVTVTGKGNYTGTTTANFTINKAALTITANSYTIDQGEALPAFTVSYSGFKNGETSSVLTTQPVISCNATSTSSPGNYDIIVSGAEAQNYVITYVKGTLTINEVSVSITVNSLGKGTYCSEHPLDFTNVSGIKAYIISGFDPSAGNLIITRVYEVPAGTGLFIDGTPGTTYDIPVKSTNFYYVNMMKGITVATVIPIYEDGYTNYTLGSDGHGGVIFRRSGGTATSPANRAYVQIPTSMARTRSSLGIEEDGTTGFEGIRTPDTEDSEGDYYNLNGQKVQSPKRGFYIKNGKKIIKH